MPWCEKVGDSRALADYYLSLWLSCMERYEPSRFVHRYRCGSSCRRTIDCPFWYGSFLDLVACLCSYQQVLSFLFLIYGALLFSHNVIAFSGNQAVYLDGMLGRGEISTSADNVFDIGDGVADTSVSVSSWVKFDSFTGNQEVFSHHIPLSNSAAGRKISLYVRNTGGVVFGVSDGTDLLRCEHPTTLTAGQWHHISGSYKASSSSELSVWVDGQQSTYTSAHADCTQYPSSKWNIKINTLTTDIIKIGGYSTLSSIVNRFDGQIDELAVWSESMTDSQLQSIYNSGNYIADVTSVKSSNVLAYWKMNETSGNVAQDSSVNNADIDWVGTYSRVAPSWDVTPTATITPANSATNVSQSATVTIAFDHGVRKADDTELTNADLSSYITLKDSNVSGADIAYSATITSDKRTIAITPLVHFQVAKVCTWRLVLVWNDLIIVCRPPVRLSVW